MIYQNIIQKYGKKFAAKSDKKNSATEGVHFAADGSVVVTNRQYLLRIREAHKLSNPTTIHAASGAPIVEEYPDTSRIFPSSFIEEIRIDQSTLKSTVKRVKSALDVAKAIGPVATISIDCFNGVARISASDPDKLIELGVFLGNTRTLQKSKRTLNAEYLHTALSVFADAGSEHVTINLGKPLDPIVLTDDQLIDVLILPYRIAEQ